MITNLNDINKIAPLSVNLYYPNGNVDALYGPYSAPKTEDLYFTYEKYGESIRVPKEGVFTSKLEYAKELAKHYLTEKGVFTLGRKVLLINDEEKPIEYTVSNNNEGNIDLVDSVEVNIYQLNFNSTDAEGAMISYEVYGDYYNLPESKFITPKYVTISGIRDQIFMGWRVYKPSQNNENEMLLSENVYSVPSLINLSENFYFNNNKKVVDLYTEYIIPEEVTIDFEDIIYDSDYIDENSNIVDLGGYIKLETYNTDDGNIETIKPDDWDYNYNSYFYTEGSKNYYTYIQVSSIDVYEENFMPTSDNQWNKDNYGKWFQGNYEPNKYPPLYNNLELKSNIQESELPQYVWEPAKHFNSNLDFGMLRYTQRKWYKLEKKPTTKEKFYVACSGNLWSQYKNETLYTKPVINKLSMFSNGKLYGDVLYDTFNEGLITANTGSTIQISSELREPYKSKYIFDHWLIEVYETINTSQPQYTHEYTTSTTTFIFDDIKHKKSSNDEYCDYYKIKAIYKKRPTYCKLFLTTNSNNENLLGNTCIYGMVKTKNVYINDNAISNESRIKLCEINNKGEYIISENIKGVSTEVIPSTVNELNITYFKIDTERYPTIQIVGEPYFSDNMVEGSIPRFFKWTGCIENTCSSIDLTLIMGGIYELKSWFIYDGDLKAKVNIKKYTGDIINATNITVGIYDWKNEYLTCENGILNIGNLEEQPKKYLLDNSRDSIFNFNTDISKSNNKKYITGMNYNSTSKPNINILPNENNPSIRRCIDIEKRLDESGVAYIDIDNVEKRNGCYLIVEVEHTDQNKFRFNGWSDGNTDYTEEFIEVEGGYNKTRYIRYIEVDSTDTYTFVAMLSPEKNKTITNNRNIGGVLSVDDMVINIKDKFSGVKKTQNDNNITKGSFIKGGINNGLSLGGSVYVGENALEEVKKNDKTLKITIDEIIDKDGKTEIISKNVFIETDDDIKSTSDNTEITNLVETPVIQEIINITTQNVGKIETTLEDSDNIETAVKYDNNFNKLLQTTTTEYKSPILTVGPKNKLNKN